MQYILPAFAQKYNALPRYSSGNFEEIMQNIWKNSAKYLEKP
jgi:hypothetical protein